MSREKIERLSADELWDLYHEIQAALIAKTRARMHQTDTRLHLLSSPKTFRLHSDKQGEDKRAPRAPYPPVAPKFRNPDDPSQTWAGRGLRPRWLTLAIEAGRNIEDFKIGEIPEGTRGTRSASRTIRSAV